VLEKLEALVKQAKKGADAIAARKGVVRMVSHYDADGIASAAIMAKALLRANKKFHMTIVKQLTEEAVAGLSAERPEFLLILDMGAGQLELLDSRLPGTDIVILDHHQCEGAPGQRTLHVNPMDFGIQEDISGSGVAYLVARAMSPGNRDLAGIAIIGAIGDSQAGSIGEKWGLFGINSEILKDAMETRKVRLWKGLRLWGRYTRPLYKALAFSIDPLIPGVSGSESSAVQFLNELHIEQKKGNGDWRTLADLSEDEQKRLASGMISERIKAGHPNAEWIFGDVYELLDKGIDSKDAGEFATLLNACGKMGKGYVGVELCLNVPRAFLESRWVMEKYRKAIGTAVRWLSDQVEKANPRTVRKKENGWYLLTGSSVGEHIISNVMSIVEKSADSGKPIFAFADAQDGAKVSARASDILVKGGLNLKAVCTFAAGKVGGRGGGHSGAAGATIPAGSEEAFMAAAEEYMSGKVENK
jgi:RecJ-like exonuclease